MKKCELVMPDGYQRYWYNLSFPAFHGFNVWSVSTTIAHSLVFPLWTCSKWSWAKGVGTGLSVWSTLGWNSKLASGNLVYFPWTCKCDPDVDLKGWAQPAKSASAKSPDDKSSCLDPSYHFQGQCGINITHWMMKTGVIILYPFSHITC